MTDPATDPAQADDPTAAALRRALGSDFQLQQEIGRGGMGVVYLAHDRQLHRDVAIKTLPPHLAADAVVRSRFLREARTAAALSHPNIVPIYSAAERDGVVYFSMGFVEGESLAERIARSGPLSPDDVVALLEQLADALGSAHARGVVHRDVKAENVLLDQQSGRAMVTDFGIARVAETQPMTATGTVLGTVQYMSPEQVNGENLDGRSDLYSLGVLAFLALTGRFPFERATASAVVVAHVNARPPRVTSLVPHCPPVLDDLVARLLSKSPADRYPDAGALRSVLQSSAFHAHRLPVLRDVPVPGTSRSEPVFLSSREAQEVWSRAAELQANTGMIVPPPSFSPRDADSLTVGLSPAVVQESAIEAGIDEKYVAQAMRERVDMQRGALAQVTAGELMQKRPNPLLGARTKLEYTASFDGELNSDDFEEIADEVRRALSEMVTVSAVGRTLTINSTLAPGRQVGNVRALQLQVSSRNGRTRVRIYEDLQNVVMQWYMGVAVGAGSGLSALVGVMAARASESAPIVVGTLAALGGALLLGCRAMYMRTAKKRDAQLQDILRRVIARAQQCMDERSSGDPRRLK